MRIDARLDAAQAARWKAVRLDNCSDVAKPGETLVWADEDTGSYGLRDRTDKLVEHTLGAHALKLVPRR